MKARLVPRFFDLSKIDFLKMPARGVYIFTGTVKYLLYIHCDLAVGAKPCATARRLLARLTAVLLSR